MRGRDAEQRESGAPSKPGRPAMQVRRPSNLTDRVYNRLRDAIVSQELEPGRRIGIEELAGMLGVSRTPVREALPALQQLGLIAQTENGGFRVAPLDATYVWEVYAVRSALESLAVEVVTQRLSDEDLQELRTAALPSEPCADGDYSEMFGPDLGLHNYIRSRCPLTYVNALIDNVRIHRSRLLELERSADPGHRKSTFDEHRAIMEAMERRDAKAARRLMRQHLDRVGTVVATLAEERQRNWLANGDKRQ